MNTNTLEDAKAELQKLPLLGPALWLFARDEVRRFTFVADLDWRLMPPLVLDQCQLLQKDGVPWAFCTWAWVDDAVHARLQSGEVRLAPHEWRQGKHPWLVDVVGPFGDLDEVAAQFASTVSADRKVMAWLVPPGQRTPQLKVWGPDA